MTTDIRQSVEKWILTIGSKFRCDKPRNIQLSITYSKSHPYSFNIRPITPNVWTTVANFNSEETCQESVITKTVIQKVNRGYSIVQYQVDYGGYSTRQTVRHCLGWHSRSKMSKSTIKRRSRIETRAELPSRHRDYPFSFFFLFFSSPHNYSTQFHYPTAAAFCSMASEIDLGQWLDTNEFYTPGRINACPPTFYT